MTVFTNSSPHTFGKFFINMPSWLQKELLDASPPGGFIKNVN